MADVELEGAVEAVGVAFDEEDAREATGTDSFDNGVILRRIFFFEDVLCRFKHPLSGLC